MIFIKVKHGMVALITILHVHARKKLKNIIYILSPSHQINWNIHNVQLIGTEDK